MSQVTWRAPSELVERVQNVASAQGRSMNDYLTRVLEVATSPDEQDSESERMRARFARAGLMVTTPAGASDRPSQVDLKRARAEAGRGIELSELVSSERR